MQEIWKDIKFTDTDGIEYDYTGLYQISNMGNVRSLNYNKTGKVQILKPRKTKDGYLQIQLCKNGEQKQFYIHRLIAIIFIPNNDNLPIVNHIDENPSNNCVDNLEWCTQQYNTQYSSYKRKGKSKSEETKHKMSKSHKGYHTTKVICLETKQVFGTVKEAEEWCGKKGVGKCCRNKRKTCGGYKWYYLEDYESLINE